MFLSGSGDRCDHLVGVSMKSEELRLAAKSNPHLEWLLNSAADEIDSLRSKYADMSLENDKIITVLNDARRRVRASLELLDGGAWT